MAKLSKAEQKMLERLQAKSEAPDAGPVSRTLRANIDLGDPEQIKRAQRYGFLDPDDDDDGDEEDDETQEEETPKRRGYFNNE